VTAVVLGWNGRDDTLACLRSLDRATYPELSVVVVDNGSTDGGPDAVAAEFPEVTLIRLDENRGFAGGVNVGVAAALGSGADFVLLLNNDATVEAGLLEPLVAAVGPGVGAACPQILDGDGSTIWYAGAAYDPRRGHQGRHTGYGQPPLPATDAPYDTDDEAGAIANNTIYGLSREVSSADVDRAFEVAKRMRTAEPSSPRGERLVRQLAAGAPEPHN